MKAGRGGDGIISWAKTKYNSRLGPAGGSGGNGGSIYLVVDSKYSDFSHLKNMEKKAPNGTNGQKDKKSGSSGSDIYLKIPENTEIYDLSKKIRRTTLKKEDRLLICRGGRGGRGNSSFKNAQFQAPWLYELGEEGESLNLLLIKEGVNYVGVISLSEEDLSSNLIERLQEVTSKENKVHFFSFPFSIFERDPIKPFYLKDLELCKTIILVTEPVSDGWKTKQEQLVPILKDLGFYSFVTIFFGERDLQEVYKELLKDLKKITQLPCFKPKGSIQDDDYIEYSDDLFPDKEGYQIVKVPEGWEVNSKRLSYWSSRIPQTTLHNIERLKTKLKVEEIIKQIKKSGGLKGETLKICNYTTSIY